MNDDVVERVVSSVRADLTSGVWDERNGHLRQLPALDVGLRLITNTHPDPRPSTAARA